MTSFPWTDEQKVVFESASRIRLVQAGPGSGKTRVFAQVVDTYIRNWGTRTGGVAALSFTNTARDEIEGRVSEAAIAPHFVGTLDSFFLRFVIGPFGHLAGLPRSGARLIPSPLDDQLTEPAVNCAAGAKKDFVPVFRLSPVAGTESAPEFMIRRLHGLPSALVPTSHCAYVLKEKEKEWTSRARVTHADCSYLVARILLGKHGESVRALLIRRFPVICVDEFQDTGHFLSRALLSILSDALVTAVLVGDADQKIFGFSGVSGDLFTDVLKIPGSEKFGLQVSQRCSVAISDVASALSRSGGKVLAADGAVQGEAFLAKHSDPPEVSQPPIVSEVIKKAEASGCKALAVLVRTRATKARLLRKALDQRPPLKSRGAVQLGRSLDLLRIGNGRRALDIASALVCRILLDSERPSVEEFREKGIDLSLFRRELRRMIIDLARHSENETWGNWAEKAKRSCDRVAVECGITGHKLRLGGAFKTNPRDKTGEPRLPPPAPANIYSTTLSVEVLTIHEAKGREFDGVLVYWEKPKKIHGGGSTCPSNSWWVGAEESEEREVAFVAVTRAKAMLVLCVHETSWNALQAERKTFADVFGTFPSG